MELQDLDVDKLARLTRINLSAEERTAIAGSLGKLVSYFDDILTAEPDEVVAEANANIAETENYDARPVDNVDFLFDSEQVLERDGGKFFLIPRVIE